MLARKSIIIIPFHLPWDWSADFERQTVLELSKRDYRVIVYLYRDSNFFLKRVDKKYPSLKGVRFYQPFNLIPFKRVPFILMLNQYLNLLFIKFKYTRGKKSYIWLFDPFFKFFMNFFSSSQKIYDCVDYRGSEDPAVDRSIREQEDWVIKNSDYFFVNSQALLELHRDVREGVLVPQGFDLSVYSKRPRKRRNFSTEKPLVGFVGSIDSRIDYKLVLRLVKACPDYNFVFWGPINFGYFDSRYKTKHYMDKLLGYKNVIYGKSDRDSLPGIVSEFDVCIIPYDVGQNRNKYCYPMKLFEYFYLGKPVIATRIIELERFPGLVELSNEPSEWKLIIRKLLRTKLNKSQIFIERKLSIANSWKNKIDKIIANL